MTERPFFSDSRRKLVCAAVAVMLVLVAMLLLAGCMGDCPQVLHTVTITKLDPTGNVTWTKVLDTGLSNTISSLVPTSDGGFVTAGSISSSHSYCTLNSQARIIRFTGTGEVLWDRSISDLGGASEIIQMHDGGFAALVGGSNIYRLDYEGRTLWNRSTGYVSLYGSRIVIGETRNSGLIVAGPLFVKFDSDGNIQWNRSENNESDWGFLSINEIKGGHEYLIFSSEKKDEIRKIFFDAEGNLLNSSEIITEGQLTGYHLFDVPDGYRLLYSEDNLNTTMMHLNPEGTVIDKQTINGSKSIVLTEDLGYFYAKKTGNQIQTIKLDENGISTWNNTIPNANLRNLDIVQVIQTSDGGFVVITDNGVQKDISSLN
jgi:hypothetical protein